MLPGLPSPWNDRHQLTPAFQEELKAKLLALIQSPDDCILSDNAYSQLTLVACIFVKQDFPAQWPQMNHYLLSTFESLF